ncbi:BTAD domain-containing putative transcriptional regulator [Saccharomonospora sp. NB11]|jgi:DNA-binding SARP family transcriptional activator/DNA-binding CsgD family transcriptional regulator|uniref:BTAD domain-containing putative transcriptional regulator n=1 Tax=Saccharomonospora sp. NB11 TaxID=1642298 RepID=UPI0018D074B9|nr:BTAD domain-containing putative transcriptional regulator [Saccharomonospora sp. NB11]
MATTVPEPPLAAPDPVAPRLTVEDLSVEERAVLRAVGRGLNDTEIAAKLGLPLPAVRSCVTRLQSGLGQRDRCALIVYAFDHGVVSPATPASARRRTRTVTERVRPRLRIAALGPLRAWSDGTLLNLGPVQQQAVLAALALRPDVTVSRQELLHDGWGLEAPQGNVVQVYVYRLRKCLQSGGGETVISRDRLGYRFVGQSAELDVTRLDALGVEAETAWHDGDLASAVEAHRRALELFDGEPLAGLPGPFAEMERVRLTERRLSLTTRRAEGLLRLSRHAQAIDELWTASVVHPHSEAVAALLMRALHESGRRADALAVFTRVRRLLVDDLGVEPSERLRRLHYAVLRDERPRPTLALRSA